MIRLRVVHAGQQMYSSGARRRETDAELAAELGVAAGHERRRFLVPRLDELDAVAGPVECTDDAVDAVARIAVDTAHAPGDEARDQSVGYGVGHDFPKRLASQPGVGAATATRAYAPRT